MGVHKSHQGFKYWSTVILARTNRDRPISTHDTDSISSAIIYYVYMASTVQPDTLVLNPWGPQQAQLLSQGFRWKTTTCLHGEVQNDLSNIYNSASTCNGAKANGSSGKLYMPMTQPPRTCGKGYIQGTQDKDHGDCSSQSI